VQCGKQGTTMVKVCVEGVPGSALEGLGRTLVMSLHLDATSEGKRVSQLLKCLETVREVGGREAILAGDMNTDFAPGSCVAALLGYSPSEEELEQQCFHALRMEGEEEGEGTTAELQPCAEASHAGEEEQMRLLQAAIKCTFPSLADKKEKKKERETITLHPSIAQCNTMEELQKLALRQWAELHQHARTACTEHRINFAQVPTGPTRAGWEHGASGPPCVGWRLDHILYTPRVCDLLARWVTLAEGDDLGQGDSHSLEVGLPNRTWPSDHLPVAASFKVHPPKALDEVAADVLRSQLDALIQSQTAALQGLSNQQAEALTALEIQLGTAVAGADSGKKAKKQKCKPPPEFIALKQQQRAALNTMKESQQRAREGWILELGDLELDIIEGVLGGGVKEWARLGTKH